MKLLIHRFAAFTATFCIALFFLSTIIIEIFGPLHAIAQLKAWIVTPGLFILLPSMAIAGGTGFSMAKTRKNMMTDAKKKRMPFIAMNGLIILLPAAITLNYWATAGNFDTSFYVVQALELIAGGVNCVLMVLNIRDGNKLARNRK